MTVIFFILLIVKVTVCVEDMINIDVNISTSRFYHFWKSTGFCPPDPKEDITKYLLNDEQKLNIALIGALPNHGIVQVRIHWLLNLLTTFPYGNETRYNFTHMDAFLSHLNHHSLRPGFEFMGASNRFIKFEKGEFFWRKLVKNIVERYTGKFGIQQVSKWRFETWNEPDLKGYNVLNFTVSEYLNYVKGCSMGLQDVFSGTKHGWTLGGPAGLFRDKAHPLCWGLLKACNQPKTQQGAHCPLQFLSFHRKGRGSSSGVLNSTSELLDVIHDRFPGLKNMPVGNDEADIQENWSESHEWRADARYAAMIIRVVAGYFESIAQKRKLKIEILSNDNAFLNYHPFYFTQRTLFARFQINTTTPPHSQFIKKPSYSVMCLLALLGDEHLQLETPTSDPLLTAVATRRDRGGQSFVSVILAYGNESRADEGSKLIGVVFRNVPEGQWRFLIYLLDNVRTNPYEVWKSFGQPAFPNRYQRRKMREVEEPRRLVHPASVEGSTLNVSLKLTIPSVHFINLCRKPEKPPKIVYSVKIFNVTWNEVLVTWKYKSSYVNCLRTFEVENQSKCSSRRRSFKRINPSDTIFMSLHHVGKDDRACEWTRGDYRVRATDYWDRPGKYSRIISYP